MSWDNLGLLSISISWIGLLFMIWYWKGDSTKTFSQNAARQKSTIVYYALLWLLCLPPFTWFLLFPFYDALQLNISFRIFSIVAALGMLIAALVPETIGWKVSLHRIAAFTMAITFMPLVLIILMSPVVSYIAQVASISALLFMIYGALYFIKHKAESIHPKLLLGQALYILSFQLVVLIAYYF